MNIKIDDPRLTAYALGEMEPAEAKEFEALLEQDPAAKAEVQEIQALAGILTAELQHEPAHEMAQDQRDKVLSLATQGPARRSRPFFTALKIAAAILVVIGGGLFVLLPSMTDYRSVKTSLALENTEETASPRAGETAEAPAVMVPPAPAPAPAADAAQAQPMEPLKIDLPKPSFVGTPKSLTNVRLAPESQQQIAASVAPPPPPAPPAPARLQHISCAAPTEAPAMPAPPAPGVPQENVGVYHSYLPPAQAPGTESYGAIVENEFKLAKNEPLSTFSIDVDTASYANVRRFLNDGQLPPRDAVRIEELVNYFKYDYPEPDGESPFSVTVESTACPWDRNHSLAMIGLRGRSIPRSERAPINLVFLLDVSGSMQSPDKLPLLKKAMRLLVDFLDERDRVGIVTYASNTGVALPTTSGADKSRILAVLDMLEAGGSTNGAGGIQLAYDLAARSLIQGGMNRVVLATDGDFNVGISDNDALNAFIADKAKSGVFLSVLGFGEGNLQDDKLEGLADKGNGNYAYIDSFTEARRVLLDEVAGTMMTIAKDVKIQVEFNPAQVGAYRLIGYENRMLAAQDFNDDRKDAGEIGSGHTVTALYELVPPDKTGGLGGVDPLKYQTAGQQNQPQAELAASDELMTVKLRYKRPDGAESARLDVPVLAQTGRDPSNNLKFASAVAMFGMLLRDSQNRGAATFDTALALAEQARGDDTTGQRTEFLSLVQTARALAGPMPVLAKAAEPLAPGMPEPAPAPVAAAAMAAAPAHDVVAQAPVPPAPAGPQEELKLELPKPNFVGTPKNIVSSNLDPASGKPQPALMVPVGTRLLSHGAAVTASDPAPIIGELEMITDGDKEGADGSFVEFGPGMQWVQIDLGDLHKIAAVAFWHYHSQARVYFDVIVRVSDDPDFIRYSEIFNNDHDNSGGLGAGSQYDYIETNCGKVVAGNGVQARYVRLYSNGNTSNDMNHMIEVEVYGK